MAHFKGKCGESPAPVSQEFKPPVTVTVDIEDRGHCPVVVRLHTKLCGGKVDEATVEPDTASHPSIRAYKVSKLEISCCADREHTGEHDCDFVYKVQSL